MQHFKNNCVTVLFAVVFCTNGMKLTNKNFSDKNKQDLNLKNTGGKVRGLRHG